MSVAIKLQIMTGFPPQLKFTGKHKRLEASKNTCHVFHFPSLLTQAATCTRAMCESFSGLHVSNSGPWYISSAPSSAGEALTLKQLAGQTYKREHEGTISSRFCQWLHHLCSPSWPKQTACKLYYSSTNIVPLGQKWKLHIVSLGFAPL